MPLDGITLSLVTKELKGKIIGTRIDKIYQPSKNDVVFNLRSREGNLKLYISASSNIPRINLTDITPENPATPPMFCMFLRKHLTGCTVTDINQLGLDRVIFIDLKGTNEIGDSVKFRLAVEIMAKHSNLIIINEENIIVEAIKKTDCINDTLRQILPGFKYTLPPVQNKMNILTDDIEDIKSVILSKTNKMLSSAVLDTLEGFSPLVSRELASRVCSGDIAVAEMTDIQKDIFSVKLNELKQTIIDGGTPSLLTKDEGKLFDISFTDITQYGFAVNSQSVESYSELIDKFYSEKNRAERTGQISKDLQKTISNLISRATRKFEARKAELEECKDKEKFRIWAELILANQYSLGKGCLYYDLENYYDECKPIRIKADPALSPSANAQKYFKEYNKLKTAEKMLQGLIEESETEINYLESVFDSVKRADGFTEISEIKNELYDEGFLKRSKALKGKKPKPLPPLKYVSDDGYTILVGRNNVQNELLSFKTAAKDDSWFHTQSFPGSHVIVVGNGEILPELTCRQAAAIAAYNSSARDSSQVAVDYTEARELKKPKGGKTGMVIYHTYNTMWVKPDKELCERLRKKQ